MKIGIDLRPLQTGHKFRGIGAVTYYVSAELAALKGPEDQIVAYLFENSEKIDLTPFGDDVIVEHLPHPKHGRLAKVFPGMNSRAMDIVRHTCDVFVQYDFHMGVPKDHRSILLIHDIIPIQFGNQYPFSYLADYKTARRVGLSRKHAITEKALRRYVYIRDLNTALRSATEVLAVSESSARDIESFAEHDITATPAILGFTPEPKNNRDGLLMLEKARLDGLGLKKDNFLFFVGGVDDRRRIDELVAAFNYLRSTGHNLKLVLGGHDFEPDMSRVFSPAARHALEESSYRDDICMLGFISDQERDWLYEHAKAFVFPTEYEGFGIPILESQAVGCPIIVYNNSAVPEVAGPNTFLADDWMGIVDRVNELEEMSKADRKQAAEKGIEWVHKFTWAKTAKSFMKAIERAADK